MTRSILLFTAVIGFGYLTLTSYQSGTASPPNGLDRTGGPLSLDVNNNPKTCGECHSGGQGNMNPSYIKIDSLGVNKNSGEKYSPGTQYNITVYAIHNFSTKLPKYGIQFVALRASDTTTAGTLSVTAPLQISDINGVKYVEQATPIMGVSGVYSAQFKWTGKVGDGTVNFYGILLAVDSAGNTTGDLETSPLTFNLSEGITSVAELSQNIRITAYPNPVADRMSLKFEDAEKGTYTVSVFDLSGKKLHAEELQVNSANANITLHTSTWAPGLYFAQIMKDGAQRMMPVVKK